jgi:ABC-type amino acid transport substrate-binding protein
MPIIVQRRTRMCARRFALVTSAVAALLVVPTAPLLSLQQRPAPAAAAPANTVQRIRLAGAITMAYRTDARPFSYRDAQGSPEGYSVAMCRLVAEAFGGAGQPPVKIEWLAVTAEDRFSALTDGRADLLCGAETITLSRRAQVSFSLPIYPGGVGALMRADAPARLRDVLSGRGQTFQPTWRAAAASAVQARAFAAVRGTTGETWLASRIADLQIRTTLERLNSYEDGLGALLDRSVDAVFGERAVLAEFAQSHPASRDLALVDRLFTQEPLALAMRRGDDEFTLFVDRALTGLYRSGLVTAHYAKWFGEPDSTALAFFRWNTLPE